MSWYLVVLTSFLHGGFIRGVIPVNSSNLAAVGYSLGLLTIEFHSGGVYQYFQVPPEIYFGLMRAESHGKYFHARIKKNYSWRRIN